MASRRFAVQVFDPDNFFVKIITYNALQPAPPSPTLMKLSTPLPYQMTRIYIYFIFHCFDDGAPDKDWVLDAGVVHELDDLVEKDAGRRDAHPVRDGEDGSHLVHRVPIQGSVHVRLCFEPNYSIKG